MTHELKIWPQYFERVRDGSKTFEVRNNDRGFQMGDIVKLKEYRIDKITLPEDHRYTGRILVFKIGYVLPIDNNQVVFSLISIEE